MLVRCWICAVFFSENVMQNLLIFSDGMGFSILGLLLLVFSAGIFDMMLLGGTSRHIG